MKTAFELIEEHGLTLHGDIEHFAELVRADERNRFWTQEDWNEYERSIAAVEREACAKLCEEPGWNAANWCAKAIRARGDVQ